MRAPRAPVLALLGTLIVPSLALADNFEEFGLGARAQAMGGAFTALASDSTATYYNPGGLTLSRHVNLSLGFSFADYALTFDSENFADDDDVERINDLSAFTVGFSSTIPLDIPDRLALGVSIFFPTRGAISLRTLTPKSTGSGQFTEPEWFAYGNRHDRLHVLVAGALKIPKVPWASLGVGASIFVDAKGQTTIATGAGDPVTPEFSLRLKPDASLVLGLMITPADWISFGLTYRQELSFKLDFPAQAKISSPASVDIPLTLEAITFFTPHQVQFGVAVNLTDSLLLTFDFSWSGWSAYNDPYLVESSTVAAVVQQEQVDLNDVISPKLGAEFVATDWLLLRAGYWYRNSRTEDQGDEVTNLVDSDKHVFTAGVSFSFGQPPELVSDEAKEAGDKAPETLEEKLVDASADLDLFFQYHLHDSVSASKPAGDPVGSWDAGGNVVNFGFLFTVRF
jgi:hypothetical protein